MGSLLDDARHAVRVTRASPGVSLAVVSILTLVVGTTTPTFSMMNSYLLRPLPLAEPDRLVHVWSTDDAKSWLTMRTSVPDFLDWRAKAQSFSGLAAFNYTAEVLGDPEGAREIPAARVSANLFDVLGRQPVLGRGFSAGEDLPGAADVVRLSHGLWHERYAGARDVLGRTVKINGKGHTIIGVMPDDFVFPLPNTSLWVPRTLDVSVYPRGASVLQVVGRLRDGVSPAGAQTEMSAITASLAAQFPESNRGRGANVADLRQSLNFASDVFRTLWIVMFAAHAGVLLIACANISSLLLARMLKRQREVAIRTSLGASRGRLARQFLFESVLLGLAGAVGGCVLATPVIGGLRQIIPDDLYRVGPMSLDLPSVVFTLAVALLAAVIFGIVPAVRGSGSDPMSTLKQAGGYAATSARRCACREVWSSDRRPSR